jgi:NifU-like protein involved in Fe-S cluster formation
MSTGSEDPLGPQVRGLFAALRHAGEPAATSAARVHCGDAGREQRGTRVRFMLYLAGERLIEVRYRAYGCPYTLAACEWLATQLERGGRDSIGGPAEWAQQLGVPPARLGRLLVVEDALKAAFSAADKTVTNS